ncbi:dihydroxyacetone kinase family protein [Lysinimonas soli]|uniref:Dihydroxyacetone kinase family protein n=1 Tax=Lysinimonas soli TaxID=1074233 RepID=A0ABW0NKA1_9MICO
MSYLLNDPADFTDEMITGFVDANSDIVRRVSGGVVRTGRTPAGQVAVVIGGGSGHYPAFGGLVGRGLAHGAAMGNVFASPSAQQVYSVAKSVATDAGVLFSYGNYAGDVLNFDQAQQRLIAEGIPCRTVVVTDDIYSAEVSEIHKRRGIAGDLAVFRAAAWAAERGGTLDEVFEFATRANERTRSVGVAFTGCTLPGAAAPLFTVTPGRMAVGMGIHGEPGIEEQDLPTAEALGRQLVDRLLDARPLSVDPSPTSRVAVILNGLGSVKYEELFVTYATVAARLRESGMVIVQPEVGELVTSFEMAGVSLTLVWLDDELERAWLSACETSAYRRGRVIGEPDPVGIAEEVDEKSAALSPGTPESRACAQLVVDVLGAIKRVIDENVDELGRLDAIAGDGDHGIGMQRGATAALAAARKTEQADAGAGATLAAAGDAWADRAGGTSGALWGLALRAVADSIGDENAPDAATVSAGISAAADAIARVGKAELGDKTMLDALIPFAEALASRVVAGSSLTAAWRQAAEVATTAAQASADLIPRIGRARPHVEKSLGTPDPGAVSLALAATAVAVLLEDKKEVAP